MPDEDLFDDDQNDDQDSSTIRQMRKELDEAKKQIKSFGKKEEELNTLREYRSTQETKVRVSNAAELLPEEFKGLADVFAEKHEGELSKEAADAFLQARGLAAKPEPTPEPEPSRPQFTPTSAGQPPSAQSMTRAEIDKQVTSGEITAARAMEMFAEGRVELTNQQVTEDLNKRLKSLS